MTPTERSLRLSAAMSEREMRMYEALRACADDLAAEIDHAYGAGRPMSPVEQRRYDRDMAPVRQAYAILASIDAEILSTHSDPGPAPITTGA